MAEMEIVRQFNSELSTLYQTKPPISKAKVTSITRLALKAVKYYKHVIQSLEKFVQKCRPEYKIPALYVIDSIIRQSRHQFGAEKDVFGPRFGKNITNSFQNFFKCLPEEQSKLIKVLNLWQKNKVYTPEVIQPLLNMAHTRPMTTDQGSPTMTDDVKAAPADTTQPVVGHMTQAHASQPPVASETPQEQAYIALLQQQQEEQMRHIRELEARLQRQQQMNQQLQVGGDEEGGEPKFQLPTEVFAQIQALTGIVKGDPPGAEQYSGSGGNYEGLSHSDSYEGDNRSGDYGHQYSQQQEAYPHGGKYGDQPGADQSFRQGYDQRQHENSYMASQQHQGFVDDFDYGDDQDDQQRIEEKKRQLEQEATRLDTASSYEHPDTMNARQRIEQQFRQQQQMVSGAPPQAVPESKAIPETLQPSSESAISAFQPTFAATAKSPRSRSRSPRSRRNRDGERDSASDRDRERGRDRQMDDSDRNRQRNRGDRDERDRTREDRDRARSDRGERDRMREGRDKARMDREERNRTRGDRDERERSREERDRPREERERPRENRDDRERPREERERSRDERDRPREEREKLREERESTRRSRDSERETLTKEEKTAEEKKEVKVEKWVPPLKEGHVSVCSRTIWLGRLHRNTTKESLQELFEECGEVQIIDMIPPRGCAYIQMAEREAAYNSLSNRQILKQNFKLAWAPAKGAKEYKEHFVKELGVTYIPVNKLQESEDTVSSLAEGGWIDPRTIPESLRKKEEEAAAAAATSAANTAGQPPGVLGMPLGPPPFTGMPPGQGVVPGMPRLPFGLPGMPLPGMIPPGMNVQGLPGMQFQPGMGNMPFQRLPMNNRMPFVPGVNPFMMPGLMPGMQQGAPMPGMPPFFRGPPPMNGPPPTNAGDAAQPQDVNQGEVAAQSDQSATEPNVPQGENVPVTQESGETGFQGQPQEQGQNAPNPQNAPEPSPGPEQFGAPNMGQSGGPPFQRPPPFHGGPGGPPFQPPFEQQVQRPFHGDPRFQGPPPFHEQGGPQSGPQGQWGHQGGPDNEWRPEGRPWGPDGGPHNENWGPEGERWGPDGGERWGPEGERWGPDGEQWRHDDRPWGRGNDRRGRRDRRSQDEWVHEEPFDRRKRGRFDNDRGPHRDRHQGSRHDRHQGPPFDRHERPPFGRDQPPRFGPPGRGPPFPRDGPPPFDDRTQWLREEQRGRWGEEEGQFRENPMEQQQGFETDPQAGGQPDQEPNAQWDSRQEDGQHFDRPRDIPSLMDNQLEPPQDVEDKNVSEPPIQVSQEESLPESSGLAKGWAEINDLKARLAMNKTQGATSGLTTEKGFEEGVGNEQSNVAEVKPDVYTAVTPAPGQNTQVTVEGDVPELLREVKKEQFEQDDQVQASRGSDGMNVDNPVQKGDEPITFDTAANKQNQESSMIVSEEAANQEEQTKSDAVPDKPYEESPSTVPEYAGNLQENFSVETVKVKKEPGMEENEDAQDVEGRYVSESAFASTVPGQVGDNMGCGEIATGSKEVKTEPEEVKTGSELASKEANMISDEVKIGSDNIQMVSNQTQSEKFDKSSQEMESNERSDAVTTALGIKLESNEALLPSVGSEITAHVEAAVESVETRDEFGTENQSLPSNEGEKPTTSESRAAEGSQIVTNVEIERSSDQKAAIDSEQAKNETEHDVALQSQNDASSEGNLKTGEAVSNPVTDTAPVGDDLAEGEPNDETGDVKS